MLALLALAGCRAEKRTMLVVEVQSNLAVGTEVSKVVITVENGAKVQKLPFSLEGEYALPLRVGLLELDDLRGQPVNVTATAFLGANVVVAEDAIVAFLEGRSLLLQLFLARECRSVSCPADQTCTTGGTCRPRLRASGELESFNPSLPRREIDAAAPGIDTGVERPPPAPDAALDGPPVISADAASDRAAPDAPADASSPPDAAVPDTALPPDTAPSCSYRCLGGRTCQAGVCTPLWMPVSTAGAPSPRTRHALTVIGGRVLVTGGTTVANTGGMGDTFFYDLEKDSWSPGPALKQARCAHSLVTGNGKAYAFGGLSDCSNGGLTSPGLEEYDPTTNAWTIVASSGEPEHRYNHRALWLPSGEMLVFGGGGAGFSETGTGARYQPVTRVWRNANCGLPNCATGWSALFVLDAGSAVAWGGSGDLPGARLDLAGNNWVAWTPPAGTPPLPIQTGESADHWYVLGGDPVSTICPSPVKLRTFDRKAGTWHEETLNVSGVDVSSSNPHTVWTGSELFTWDALCDQKGIGWRYQPPVPAPPAADTFGGHRYLFVNEPRQWPAAREYCARYGYHLATIEDETENTWIGNTIYARGTEGFCWWTGLNDRASPGTWVWDDGSSASFRSWAPGEPTMGPEQCGCVWRVGTMKPGSWNDAACETATPQPFVCESP